MGPRLGPPMDQQRYRADECLAMAIPLGCTLVFLGFFEILTAMNSALSEKLSENFGTAVGV